MSLLYDDPREIVTAEMIASTSNAKFMRRRKRIHSDDPNFAAQMAHPGHDDKAFISKMAHPGVKK